MIVEFRDESGKKRIAMMSKVTDREGDTEGYVLLFRKSFL